MGKIHDFIIGIIIVVYYSWVDDITEDIILFNHILPLLNEKGPTIFFNFKLY